MNYIGVLLALSALIAGCAVAPPDNTLAYRAGTGVVQDVRAARVALPKEGSGAIAGSEAAKGSYGSPVERLFKPRWTEGYQLTLRMDDGSTQTVTQDSVAFQVGDRVQVTSEGRILKTTAATTPPPMSGTAPAPTSATAPAPPSVIAPAPPSVTAPAPKPAAITYRPGVGVVESASVLSLPSTSAAAGGTGASMAYRLKMADGTTQNVVQTSGKRLEIGERVEVTGDGRLVRR